MSDSWEQYGLRVMTGAERGPRAALMRAGMRLVSPIYATVARARNAKYDRGIGVQRLPRPVISVGNITTGGTGKTPVVRWLCEQLRQAGERPAVLMRGYRSGAGERSDEEAMLESLLNQQGLPPVVVHAQPDRHAGGQAVLEKHPHTTVFVMDDGFQHRRLARDFDLVLIDACAPFGFERVLPAGLLREPLAGLKRADAFLLTRADQATDLQAIVNRLRAFNPAAPIFRSAHVHVGLRSREEVLHRMDALHGMRVFLVAGIGNPEGFGRQFPKHVGNRWFADHWDYTRNDVRQVEQAAEEARADVIVTTDKDWVKITPLLDQATPIPIWRAELAVRFEDNDEAKLLDLVRSRLKSGGTHAH